MLDLVIRGGDVVDGTASPSRRGDVGVAGGRIVALGRLDGDAATVLDATGRVVTPGFVDVHTHYDAQVFWDGALTPSPLHGVTTVVGGNCGFSIAPLSGDSADSGYLLRMLARVEGMPITSLREGVPWDWTSTEQYLAAVETRLAINAGFMVGHSAMRRTVMGPDATRRAATPEEVGRMVDLLHAGLEAGGMGLSSSWARSHNDAEGDMVPSRHAEPDQLLALCRAVRDHPGTSVEFIPMAGRFEDWAKALMADMSLASGRILNWNVLTVSTMSDEMVESRLDSTDAAARRGGRVVALTMPIPVENRLTFESGFGFDGIPGWEDAMHLPPGERLAVLADPAARAELDERARRSTNPFPEITNWASHTVFAVVDPANQDYVGRSVGDIADEQGGRDPWDVLCEIVVADGLLTSFGIATPEFTREQWQRGIDVVRDRRAILGGSDAGAHVTQLATFAYPTVMLAEPVRRHGVMSLEEAVHHMTQRPAELYGLRDRGLVAEGYHADLVVLDPAIVGSGPITVRDDLPGGARRLYAGGTGIDAVFVSGVRVVDGGTLTGERGGSVLRSGRDTVTPADAVA